MAFDEVQFPTNIEWGVTGGPSFNTTVVETFEGFEYRNRNWASALRTWDMTHAVKTQAELDVLVAFFRARNGAERGFRFKDWFDYKLNMVPGGTNTSPAITGDGTSGQTGQLQKTYSDAAGSHIRPITKPVDGTVELTSDLFAEPAVLLEGEDYEIDYTTGAVTWLNEDTDTITSTTAVGDNTLVSVAAGGGKWPVGSSMYITGVTGTAAATLNNKRHKVSSHGLANLVNIETDTTGLSSTGGTATSVPASGEVIQASDFEFDVPVRFASDTMPVEISFFQTYDWNAIQIAEIRDPQIYIAQTTDTSVNGFHDVRLDPFISFGVVGGPTFKTKLFTAQSGFESRILSWDQAREEYDVAEALKSFEEFSTLQDFFHSRYGKAYGFRYRDWADYTIAADIVPDTLNETILTSDPGGGLMRVIRAGTSPPSWSSAGYWPGMYMTIDSGADAGTYLISNFFNDDPDEISIDVFNTGTITTSFGTNTITGQDVSTSVQPDGSTNRFQIMKSYRSGAQASQRYITCPIEPSEVVADNRFQTQAVAADLVFTLGGIDIDHDANPQFFGVNGRTVLNADGTDSGLRERGLMDFGLTVRTGQSATANTLSITGITQANPAVVTVTEDLRSGTNGDFIEGLLTGESVYISGVTGMTEVNDARYKITVTGLTAFELDGVDSSAFTAYTGPSGSATKTPQSEEIFTATGEFDVPVRFNSDAMAATLENYGFQSWGQILLAGIRLDTGE